jgi:hypothetical protein
MFCFMSTPLDPLRDAPLGVFAYVTRAGRPNACAVTPYVVEGRAVLTSTLAYLAKARAVRHDPRVALLAGGIAVEGRGVVGIDRTHSWFDRNLRAEELRKYPPAEAILGIPGHRRLFPWYLGRAVIAVEPGTVSERPGSDHVSVAVLDDHGLLHLRPLTTAATPAADAIEVELPGDVPDGPAVVLVHEESDDLGELHQLALHGRVRHGLLRVERSVRSDLGGGGTVAQLRTARRLAASARAQANSTAGWPPPPVG